jgi:hypothetical protein
MGVLPFEGNVGDTCGAWIFTVDFDEALKWFCEIAVLLHC